MLTRALREQEQYVWSFRPSPQWLGLLSGWMMLLVGLLGGCSDNNGEQFQEGQRPIIDAAPRDISFSRVQLGQSGSARLYIQNTGQAPLRVSDMKIEGASAGDFKLFITAGVEYAGEVYELSPLSTSDQVAQNEREFLITYTPSKVGSASAVLKVFSNDPERPELDIPLTAQEVGPRLQVNPNPIVFGQVAAGGLTKRDITLSNIGSAPLDITLVKLSDTTNIDFYPDSPVHSRDNLPKPDAPLEPNESFTFTLVYSPQVQAPDINTLQVSYLVSDNVKVSEVPISANGNEPCVKIIPEEFIDFGQATIGRVSQREVTIQNCGSSNLQVNSIALSTETDRAFFGLDALPPEFTTGDPVFISQGSSRTFFVTFTPTSEELKTGELVIDSDGTNRPRAQLPITGVGSYNQCPTATARARVLLSGDPWSYDQLTAEPLQNLELSAEESFDPDGDTLTYFWTIVQAPEGFRIGFTPNNRTQLTHIQLALVGTYVFELNVVDSNSSDACAPSRITVRAKSDRAFIGELTWETPGDADEFDTGTNRGTDLDLHLLRGKLAGNGSDSPRWNDQFFPSDCYYQNCTATPVDWGVQGDINDNPSLDRDDIDGGGPEQVNIRRPAFSTGPGAVYTTPYRLGVYFYNGHEQYGPAFATIRLFFNGSETPSHVWPSTTGVKPQRKLEVSGNGRLSTEADFWLAGEFDWDAINGPTATEINQMFKGFPVQ
jgi:hypothetical protein